MKKAAIWMGVLAIIAVATYVFLRPAGYNVPTAVADRFADQGWSVAGEAIESSDVLPPDFLLRSGRFPWRVYLDLSADGGLDFSHLPGQQVKTLRFPVTDASGKDRLKEIREKYLLWGMALLNPDGKLVGAWLTYTDKNGEFELGIPGYSLDGKDLEQVTGLKWPAYSAKYLPENQPPAGFYPPDVRTGKPVVDRVIEAVTKGDGAALHLLAKLSSIPCSGGKNLTPGDLPCPEGTPHGTKVEAFPSGACQPNYLVGSEQVRQMFISAFAERKFIYAVYQTKDGYEVIVGPGRPGEGHSLYLDALGFIVEEVHCAGPENMVPGPGQQATPLLPPIR